MECGGPAPLWPVLINTQLRIKRFCLAKRFRASETLANVGQSAARPAHSKLGAHFPPVSLDRAVRRPGAALACAHQHSTANQAILPGEAISGQRDFGERGPKRCQASALQIRRTFPAGDFRPWSGGGPAGPAPLWPVLINTQLRIKRFCLRSDFAPGRLSRTWAKALSGQRTPN